MISNKKMPEKASKAKPDIKSKDVAAATIAATQEEKITLSKDKIASLFKQLHKLKKTRETVAKVEVLSELTQDETQTVKSIAHRLRVSEPQIYNLVRAADLIRQQPTISKYISNYNLSVTDVVSISRNKNNAKEVLNAIKDFVQKGMVKPVLGFENKKKVLASKSSFSKKESEKMHADINELILKYQKNAVSQYKKKQLSEYMEHVLSA